MTRVFVKTKKEKKTFVVGEAMNSTYAYTYNPFFLLHNSIVTFVSQNSFINFLLRCVNYLYSTLILQSLARLYLFGPSISGFGFWQGKEASTICSQLSLSNEQFWLANLNECFVMIGKHFYSWVVIFETCLYFILLFKLLSKSISCCCRRERPP